MNMNLNMNVKLNLNEWNYSKENVEIKYVKQVKWNRKLK